MAQAFRLRNLETLQACPLCIICAKPREAITLAREFNLETKISSDLVDGIPDGQRLDFHIGSFTLDNSSIPYYVTSPSRQGIQTFGIEAATLFSILKPRYALHVGVCAAISGKNIRIGDVIFGERALNYEEGKWALQDGESAFKPDVKVVEVRGAAMDGFIAQADQPIYKYGDFVSGSAVRMDASSIFDRVQNTTLRNVAALDMEASAFLQAGDFTGVQCIGVIKGVSDMGDGKKGQANDKYYTTALCRAARAAKSYVKYKLDKVPKAVLDYSREPGVVITHGYFDDTIARVMDKLEYAEYKIEVKVEGLRIVLPGKLQQEDPEEEDVECFNVASFSASDGALASLIRNHGLQEITLKG
ncbi:Phosphorylase superfamily protein, partial [Fusarium austroafricanum]